MRKILVPTDFSPVSKNALIYGLNLYQNTETIFDVIHIYHPSFDPVQPEIIDSSLGMENVKKENMGDMVNSISGIIKDTDVQMNSKVEIGFTIEKIVELSTDYDLIIMGSTGTNSFLNKIFGGISSDVASKAKCPVLLIPSKVEYTHLQNIIYSCDFEGVDQIVLQKIVNFAKRYNSVIHFVHIKYDEKPFKMKFPENFNMNYSVNIVHAHTVKEGLSKYIKEKKADMVIMATKQRSFWEKIINKSHTREFALNSSVPLLVYHEK